MPQHSRQALAGLLEADLLPFALYCAKAETDNAKAIAFMWSTTAADGVDINDVGFRTILSVLLMDGVISQETHDRVVAFGN
jgi:hypothetical protein